MHPVDRAARNPDRPTHSLTTAAEQQLTEHLQEDATDRRTLRRAIVAAILFHLGLFAVTFPSFTESEVKPPDNPKIYTVTVVRFKPPPPDQEVKVPKPKAVRVPMPDPTPNQPEPLSSPEPAKFAETIIDDPTFAIPDAAPEPEPDITYVVGDVKKPEKLFSPAPRYTEAARRARIGGVVILESTIDEHGNVVKVSVVKGLPLGLSEAAMDAVRQWRFKPATLHGKPVAVYFHLTVSFQLR